MRLRIFSYIQWSFVSPLLWFEHFSITLSFPLWFIDALLIWGILTIHLSFELSACFTSPVSLIGDALFSSSAHEQILFAPWVTLNIRAIPAGFSALCLFPCFNGAERHESLTHGSKWFHLSPSWWPRGSDMSLSVHISRNGCFSFMGL